MAPLASLALPRSRAGLVLLFGIGLPAQCPTGWLPGIGTSGTNNGVFALTAWDPDGVGPLQSRLVLGGFFTTAGNVVASNVAAFDPATGAFSPLGSGVNPSHVTCAAAMPNGDLVVGGYFTTAGGAPATRIARWDGTNWTPLGSGISGGVLALLALPNGELIAGGGFTSAGGAPASCVARWDGTSWSSLGSGVSGGWVSALALLPNGDIVAGGTFTAAGGAPASRIARWDGTNWSPLGSGVSGGDVSALALLPNGDIVAAGLFTAAGGAPASRIARWDGTNWSPIGTGMDGPVFALAVQSNGDIVAAGVFLTAGGVNALRIARWNGSNWSALAAGFPATVHTLALLPNGDLVAGGDFQSSGSTATRYLARWDGTNWSAMWPGMDGVFRDVLALPNGDLVACGDFSSVAGTAASNIARWDGTSWSPLGLGMSGAGTTDRVEVLASMPNGDIVAGGPFTAAGGAPASRIARWDGTNWFPLGAGVSFPTAGVLSLLVLPNGDLLVGGAFATAGGVNASSIARWDGTNWMPLGSGMQQGSGPGQVHALAVMPNGDIVAAGSFLVAGGTTAYDIARWDGTNWSPFLVGSSNGIAGRVYALLVLPNGDLVAGGDFGTAGGTPVNGIARWDGTSWSPLGTGTTQTVYDLMLLPNGDIIAVGNVSPNYIARWDGTSWSGFGTGLSGGTAMAVDSLPDGDVVVGGSFTMAGGFASANLARLSTGCPALAAHHGAGCAGSAGLLQVTAQSLPWVGGTFRSRTTSMAVNSLGAALVGFSSPGTALSLLHPSGGPGCSLHASGEATVLLWPNAGSVDFQFTIPNNVAFAGFVLFHQVLQAEFAQTQLTGLSSSNGLRLTVGAF